MTAPANRTLKSPDTYQETIAWLFGRERFGIKLGLDTMKRMLTACGNPQRSFAAVHIAGSNGKGSTAAFIARVCQKAGYRVGLYTSPHLSDFSERIRINGDPITKEAAVRLTRVIRLRQKGLARTESRENAQSVMGMTFFECATTMAFLYFAEKRVDLAVIEVGMGGRLDATNVIQPLVTVITSIAREHEQYLGTRLEQIAEEKAGIVKSGAPLVTGARQPSVLAALRKQCDDVGSPLYRIGREFRVRRQGPGRFHYQGLFERYPGLELGMRGDYQLTNAGLALAAVELLRIKGYSVAEAAVRTGLRDMRWPGRLELVSTNPRVLLDSAHNLAAVHRLQKELLQHFTYRRLILVIGIMKDKAIKPMLRLLVSLADKTVLTRPRLDRSADPALMLRYVPEFKKRIEIVEDVKAAVRRAMSLARQDDLICVAGSLFAVGEARELFFSTVEM